MSLFVSAPPQLSDRTVAVPPTGRSRLGDLEDEAIHVLREVAGQFDRAVLLDRGGRGSAVLLQLARKAFWPANVGIAVLRLAPGEEPTARFDAVVCSSRPGAGSVLPDDTVFSIRDEAGQRDPAGTRSAFWGLHNGRRRMGQHVRVFPLAEWTEHDVDSYLEREVIGVPNNAAVGTG
jgi:sulfate adenylyltransferase subunit 2